MSLCYFYNSLKNNKNILFNFHFILECSWLTMPRQFQVHNKVIQLYIYMHLFFFKFFFLFKQLQNIEQAEFPVLHNRSLLMIYFK